MTAYYNGVNFQSKRNPHSHSPLHLLKKSQRLHLLGQLLYNLPVVSGYYDWRFFYEENSFITR